MRTFLQLPPPSQSPNLQCTLPPTLACFYSPLRLGINRFADVAACRLPRGVPLHRRIFLALLPRIIVQTTTHDDVFPLRRAESPSLTFNHVGRRLLLAKRVADTLPASGRALVYCGLLRRPYAHKQTTSHFLARKISKRAAPSTPPPHCISIIPPLPAPL